MLGAGALGRHSNTMYDVCDASLYKKLIVLISSGVEQSKTVFSLS